jgi:hypothetical protein
MPYRKLKYLPTIRKIPDEIWDEISCHFRQKNPIRP